MRKRTTITRGLVVGLLLAGATYVIGDSVELWIRGPHAPAFPQSASYEVVVNQHERGTGNPVVVPEHIEAWQLFGPHQTNIVTPDLAIPETEIKLRLVGVIDNHEGDDGWAIVQADGGPAKLYRVGEEISTKVNIRDIASSYVLLQREGRLERLPLLPWGDTKGVQGVGSVQKNDNKMADEQDTKIEGAHGKLVSGLGLEPVDHGTASGYRLAEKNGRLAVEYGMKEGDIVLSVNGYPLGTFKADQMAYSSVRQRGAANIVIRRGFDEHTSEYNVRKSHLKTLDSLFK